MNLLLNAVQATKPGGEIRVRGSVHEGLVKGLEFRDVEGRLVEVVIEDEGPGIPDIALAMQEGYSTATPEMREMGFGAGMGLPNMKKNADEILIDSKIGQGTRVRMTFLIQEEGKNT